MSNEPLLYGGQAVIRGVMMRSPRFFSVACRRESGELRVRVEKVPLSKRPAFLRLPLVRGSLALFDAMHLGVKALMFSAGVAAEDIAEEEQAKSKRAKKEVEDGRKNTSGAITDIAIGGALVTGLGMGVFLFIIFPHLVAGWIHSAGLMQNKLALNLVEGFIRVTFFISYILAIGRMKNIREVFQYHGAEHRAINTFEADRPLTLEETRPFGRIHFRCGTNFMLIVLVLSIFVFSFLPWEGVIQRIGWRLALLPLIAGMAYEALRFTSRRCHLGWIQKLVSPGLALQKLTTREPSDDQVEVALEALRAVIDAEEKGDVPQQEEPTPAVA